MTAFAVGWEVQQRLVMAARKAESRPFHPPGIFGPPAAASGCAKLLGLPEDKVRMALGIAASRTGGLFANNGTMTKSTHPGNAGRMGVEAVLLAADGFTANDSIFETPRGYVETIFGDDFDWDALLGGLGEQWNVQRHGFNIKRYPAQIGMQWATECVALLREKNGIRADDVEWLELEVSAKRAADSNPAVATGLAGKFSFEYCAAVALTQDHVGIDSFTDAVRFSAPVEAALKKIRLKPNPDIPTSTMDNVGAGPRGPQGRQGRGGALRRLPGLRAQPHHARHASRESEGLHAPRAAGAGDGAADRSRRRTGRPQGRAGAGEGAGGRVVARHGVARIGLCVISASFQVIMSADARHRGSHPQQ